MRLHIKVFLWFWLGVVVVSGTLIGLTAPTHSRAQDDRLWQEKYGPRVDLWARQETHILRTKGSAVLEEYVGSFQAPQGVRNYMCDASGHEGFDREAPKPVLAIVNALMQSSGWTQRVDPVERIIAERAIDANGKPYVVVVDFPEPSVLSRPLFELLSADFSGRPTRASAVRLAAVIGVAGIFCFVLARHIASPIDRLRLATKKIAHEQLGTRIDRDVLNRGDELADLGRDFNGMADRIENLVTAQRHLLADVSHALRSPLARLNVAISGGDTTYTILANGQLLRAREYASTIVSYRNGNPVRLDAIAHVYDGIENDKSPLWFNGERAISLSVQKQPGTNVVAVVDAVKALLPEFRAQLPPSIALDIRSDRSIAIRESVQDIKMTLLLTIALAVLVIFLFLRNISATVIPSLTLPVSLVATFAVMYLLDYSLDNLSLLALILSVAFIVDNTIVILENIVRHMEMGKAPMRAAMEGSKEIAFTIVSVQLAQVAVFIPVLFMGGIVGRLLNEFAVTIAVAILVSGFVSISLTPMLCSRFLTPP